MRSEGKLTTWKDDRGFGFIKPNDGGDDLFVHIRSFANRTRRPICNDVLTYEVCRGTDNKLQAVKVAFRGESITDSASISTQVVFAIAFMILIAGLAFFAILPKIGLLLYFTACIVAFLAYWSDKSAAENETFRTPESSLHFLGIIGGWPGALIAQQMFRHKTKKLSFQIGFWLSVAVNCSVLVWLLSPYGSIPMNFLRDLSDKWLG